MGGQGSDNALQACEDALKGRKFDVLWNGTPGFDVYFKFQLDGTVASNQTMFNGAAWRAVKRNQFTLERKNGSHVLWQFKDNGEAFRTDKPLFGLRLAKAQ